MGNTLLLIVYTPFVLFAVLIGQIAATFCSLSKWLSARIKLLAATSTWPKRSRPNQTSKRSPVMGLSPTLQPAKALLRKRLWPSNLIAPLVLTRLGHLDGFNVNARRGGKFVPNAPGNQAANERERHEENRPPLPAVMRDEVANAD